MNNAWARLTADSSTVSWIACGYPADKNNQLVFKAEGSNGMPEFLGSLGDEIVWGAFKVVGVDDRGNTVSRRPKYIFVKYTPASTTAMKRATAGRHKGAIKPIFTTHVDFEVGVFFLEHRCISFIFIIYTFSAFVRLKLPMN